jgi:hypothetical protein
MQVNVRRFAAVHKNSLEDRPERMFMTIDTIRAMFGAR